MLVTENMLDEWVRGHAADGQRVVVELVYRLVAASCPRPRERRFALGDSIGQHGPDGQLEVAQAFEPFVPSGHSLWEIGTGGVAATKATKDYKELTLAVPGTVRGDSAFIFVTPLSSRREWQYTWKTNAQADWLATRRAQNCWRDVRVIDGTRLIDWLQHFPAVEAWLAKEMGFPVHQIETLEHRWNGLRTFGEPPPLTPELFLVNRDEAHTKLKDVLTGTAVQLKLTTHHRGQVVDFIAASVANLADEARADVTGRALVISGIDAWNAALTLSEPHVLIADTSLDLSAETGMGLIQNARRARHTVIFAGPPGGIPDPSSVRLPGPRIQQIQGALENCGYGEGRARTLAQKSGGNLGSLLRCLQNLSLMPEWAEGTAAADLAIAAVLGSWSEDSAPDRAIVEALSGKAYGEWIDKVREVALESGAPLLQRDNHWKFGPRFEGWYALGPRLFNEHLDRLRTSAIAVLTENDPKFELPANERYTARIYGKVLSHSDQLRVGLAEALALTGSHPRALTSSSSGKAEATAVLATRAILSGADWLRWASLNALLPLLAEAAPGEFLDAVEEALRAPICPFDQLFAQEGDVLFGGGNHFSGVLWALETLAWDADYLTRVVVCLGELAARDPGGQWANRPSHSLTTIMLPWFPQTCSPPAKRVGAVATLLAELPDIGWKLLLSLLPDSHGISSPTSMPIWRQSIPDDWSSQVTHGEYSEQVTQYAEMAVELAKGNPKRLVDLIDHLDHLPPASHQLLLEYLDSEELRAMPDGERVGLWTGLVDLVTRHRKFSDAAWAMVPEDVDRIAAVAERIVPTEPGLRHQRLFSHRDLDLLEVKGHYNEQRKALEARRIRAVEEVAASGGIQAVLDFATAVESPWQVGDAYGFVADKGADEIIVPDLLESEEEPLVQCAAGFVSARFRTSGFQWVDALDTSRWTPSQIGHFLAVLPFTGETWNRSRRLLGEDEGFYWRVARTSAYAAEDGLESAIDRLLQYGRPRAALRSVHAMLDSTKPADSARAVRVLLAAVNSPEGLPLDGYQVVRVIQALQQDPSTDPDRLFQVEWAYLRLLDHHHDASPILLERRLATDPPFFCEVIRVVFRSRKDDKPPEELTEDEKNVATNAYHLLSGWRTPPGSQEDGTFDGECFTSWLDAVMRECRETGHLEIAMTRVGHVLVHVPPDPDGLWLHRSVAAAMNAKDAGDMRDGFSVELFNSRGVHGFSAGREERELASKYRGQAELIEAAGFQRVATTLRDLADSYDRHAARESARDLHDD